MGLDLQHKPYGALMVQFRNKYWSPGANRRSQELRGSDRTGQVRQHGGSGGNLGLVGVQIDMMGVKQDDSI